MELRNLRYFVAAYEELSLSAASKRCFISQPSISTAIAVLEEQLGQPLFIRHAKGVTPTAQAVKLYPQACNLLQSSRAIKTLFDEPEDRLPLSISLMPFLSGQRVSLLLKTLLQTIPGVDLTLVDFDDEAELRLTCQSLCNHQKEAFHHLWEDHYVLAMPTDHELAKQELITLSQLDQMPFVSRTPCDVIQQRNYLTQRQHISLNVKAVVKTEEYALDLVAAGVGVSIIPLHSHNQRADISIREIEGVHLVRHVGLTHDKHQAVPNSLFAALQDARQQISQFSVGTARTGQA